MSEPSTGLDLTRDAARKSVELCGKIKPSWTTFHNHTVQHLAEKSSQGEPVAEHSEHEHAGRNRLEEVDSPNMTTHLTSRERERERKQTHEQVAM